MGDLAAGAGCLDARLRPAAVGVGAGVGLVEGREAAELGVGEQSQPTNVNWVRCTLWQRVIENVYRVSTPFEFKMAH